MKGLLRLYPRSWRRRYGREMEALLEDVPGRLGVALDLVVGAAVVYRDAIRADRFLSACGAYLHGICVAVLLQAIGFVSIILFAQSAGGQADVHIGPVDIASVSRGDYGRLLQSLGADLAITHILDWVRTLAVLLALVAALALVMATPRLVRSLR
jgi:hypothetical protein